MCLVTFGDMNIAAVARAVVWPEGDTCTLILCFAVTSFHSLQIVLDVVKCMRIRIVQKHHMQVFSFTPDCLHLLDINQSIIHL